MNNLIFLIIDIITIYLGIYFIEDYINIKTKQDKIFYLFENKKLKKE